MDDLNKVLLTHGIFLEDRFGDICTPAGAFSAIRKGGPLALKDEYSEIQFDSLASILSELSLNILNESDEDLDYINDEGKAFVQAALISVADQVPQEARISVLSIDSACAVIYGGECDRDSFEGWLGVLDVDVADAESRFGNTGVVYVNGVVKYVYRDWVEAVKQLQMDAVDLSDKYNGVDICVLPPGIWTAKLHERVRQRSRERERERA